MTPPPVQRTHCPNCRHEWPVDEGYCPYCGYRDPQPRRDSSGKWVLLVLFILFGLPLLGFGGFCAVMGITSAGSGGDYAGLNSFALIVGVICFAIGVMILMFMVRAFRK